MNKKYRLTVLAITLLPLLAIAQNIPYDVIVGVTPQAKSALEALSGQFTYEEEIELAFDLANACCADSRTDIRYNLVHIEDIDIDEDGYAYSAPGDNNPDTDYAIANIVEAARYNNNDFESLNDYRDLVGADLALIIVDSNSLQACGIAFDVLELQSQEATWDTNAFCVVEFDCIFGNYSLHHELAHLLGSAHGQVASNTFHTGRYDYSEGYHFGTIYRTVMAYPFDGHNTRVNRYSNPGGIQYASYWTGVEDENDNARSLDETYTNLISMRSPYVWVDSTVLGDYWRAGDTVGWLQMETYPWIWSIDHGWIFSQDGTETSGYYAWDQGLNWWWTSSSFWPYIYKYDNVSNEWWLYWFYTSDGSSVRYYYDYNISQYVAVPFSGGSQPTSDPPPPPSL